MLCDDYDVADEFDCWIVGAGESKCIQDAVQTGSLITRFAVNQKPMTVLS